MVQEPPAQNHPLFSLPNVTLTPHSAGPTWDNWTKAYRNGFDNIQRVEAGRTPLPTLLAPERHPHAAQCRTDVGQLDEGVP